MELICISQQTHYNFVLSFNSAIDTFHPQIQIQSNNLRFWKFIEFLGGIFCSMKSLIRTTEIVHSSWNNYKVVKDLNVTSAFQVTKK